MIAKENAFYIFAFVLSVAIINGSGLFETTINAPEVTIPSADLSDGISEIDGDASDTNIVESVWNGAGMIKSILSTVGTIFKVLAIPYSYLVDLGFPAAVAAAIQGMVTITEVWAIAQFWGNRSTGGMD